MTKNETWSPKDCKGYYRNEFYGINQTFFFDLFYKRIPVSIVRNGQAQKLFSFSDFHFLALPLAMNVNKVVQINVTGQQSVHVYSMCIESAENHLLKLKSL